VNPENIIQTTKKYVGQEIEGCYQGKEPGPRQGKKEMIQVSERVLKITRAMDIQSSILIDQGMEMMDS
jgi:hypothetical protein